MAGKAPDLLQPASDNLLENLRANRKKISDISQPGENDMYLSRSIPSPPIVAERQNRAVFRRLRRRGTLERRLKSLKSSNPTIDSSDAPDQDTTVHGESSLEKLQRMVSERGPIKARDGDLNYEPVYDSIDSTVHLSPYARPAPRSATGIETQSAIHISPKPARSPPPPPRLNALLLHTPLESNKAPPQLKPLLMEIESLHSSISPINNQASVADRSTTPRLEDLGARRELASVGEELTGLSARLAALEHAREAGNNETSALISLVQAQLRGAVRRLDETGERLDGEAEARAQLTASFNRHNSALERKLAGELHQSLEEFQGVVRAEQSSQLRQHEASTASSQASMRADFSRGLSECNIAAEGTAERVGAAAAEARRKLRSEMRRDVAADAARVTDTLRSESVELRTQLQARVTEAAAVAAEATEEARGWMGRELTRVEAAAASGARETEERWEGLLRSAVGELRGEGKERGVKMRDTLKRVVEAEAAARATAVAAARAHAEQQQRDGQRQLTRLLGDRLEATHTTLLSKIVCESSARVTLGQQLRGEQKEAAAVLTQRLVGAERRAEAEAELQRAALDDAMKRAAAARAEQHERLASQLVRDCQRLWDALGQQRRELDGRLQAATTRLDAALKEEREGRAKEEEDMRTEYRDAFRELEVSRALREGVEAVARAEESEEVRRLIQSAHDEAASRVREAEARGEAALRHFQHRLAEEVKQEREERRRGEVQAQAERGRLEGEFKGLVARAMADVMREVRAGEERQTTRANEVEAVAAARLAALGQAMEEEGKRLEARVTEVKAGLDRRVEEVKDGFTSALEAAETARVVWETVETVAKTEEREAIWAQLRQGEVEGEARLTALQREVGEEVGAVRGELEAAARAASMGLNAVRGQLEQDVGGVRVELAEERVRRGEGEDRVEAALEATKAELWHDQKLQDEQQQQLQQQQEETDERHAAAEVARALQDVTDAVVKGQEQEQQQEQMLLLKQQQEMTGALKEELSAVAKRSREAAEALGAGQVQLRAANDDLRRAQEELARAQEGMRVAESEMRVAAEASAQQQKQQHEEQKQQAADLRRALEASVTDSAEATAQLQAGLAVAAAQAAEATQALTGQMESERKEREEAAAAERVEREQALEHLKAEAQALKEEGERRGVVLGEELEILRGQGGAERSALAGRVDAMEARVEGLEGGLGNASGRLEAELTALQEALSASAEERQQLQVRLDGAESSIEGVGARVEGVGSMVEGTQQSLQLAGEELRAAQAALQGRVEGAEARLDAGDSRLESEKADASARQAEAEAFRSAAESLESRLDATATELAQLGERAAAAEAAAAAAATEATEGGMGTAARAQLEAMLQERLQAERAEMDARLSAEVGGVKAELGTQLEQVSASFAEAKESSQAGGEEKLADLSTQLVALRAELEQAQQTGLQAQEQAAGLRVAMEQQVEGVRQDWKVEQEAVTKQLMEELEGIRLQQQQQAQQAGGGVEEIREQVLAGVLAEVRATVAPEIMSSASAAAKAEASEFVEGLRLDVEEDIGDMRKQVGLLHQAQLQMEGKQRGST